MNSQRQKEIEKNDDDDLDFFKKSKFISSKINDVDKKALQQKLQKQKNLDLAEVKNILNRWPVIQTNSKPIFIASLAIGIFLISGSIITEQNTATVEPEKTYYVNPNNGQIVNEIVELQKEPIVVQATASNEQDGEYNVDYSNLSKEDAERVKVALEQFKDIQKTLIETNKSLAK